MFKRKGMPKRRKRRAKIIYYDDNPSHVYVSLGRSFGRKGIKNHSHSVEQPGGNTFDYNKDGKLIGIEAVNVVWETEARTDKHTGFPPRAESS